VVLLAKDYVNGPEPLGQFLCDGDGVQFPIDRGSIRTVPASLTIDNAQGRKFMLSRTLPLRPQISYLA